MFYKSFKQAVIDIEANGLLDQLINFSVTPLRFKPNAELFCIVITDFNNPDDSIVLKQEQCTKENLRNHLANTTEIIWHNGIKYDAPALFLFGVLDYKIYYYPDDFGNNGEVFNKPLKITDTLLLSKFLLPDRIFGHSLKNWGIFLGNYKDDYRQVCIDAGYISKDSPKGAEFAEYHEELIPYCITDTRVTANIYRELIKENNNFKIEYQFHVEQKSADLALRQELHGFYFNKDLAIKATQDLDQLLFDIQNKVNPILPPKKLNKGEQKEFLPPTRQFKSNGDVSAFLEKFAHKIGATISEDNRYFYYDGTIYPLPLNTEICLKKETPSTIDDLDNLKAYLLDLGWNPSEWKIRDLTKDSAKKKISPEKFKAAVKRYVDNTVNGPYLKNRLQLLKLKNEEDLESFLLSKEKEFSIIVPVSPMIRVGTDKKLCPNLEKLGQKADFVKDVVEYLTYKHRRNSIAGGVEDEEGLPTKGYLSLIREDNKISTPSDTLGASCVTADTLIITDVGLKNITNVNIGDLVLTHSGKYKSVIDKIDNGVKPTYLVQLENGTFLKCTSNHPFWTDTGWVRCENLNPGKLVYTNNSAEVWETDEEFPYYYFSSFGRIINKEGYELKRDPHKESRLSLYKRGYLDLLNKDGIKVCKRIGRFIYLAFNKNANRTLEVCHLDGNPTNNNITNLFLGTSKENSGQAYGHGFLHKMRLRSSNKLTPLDIDKIKHLRSLNKTQQEIADIFSVSREHIRDILLGKKWKETETPTYSYTTIFNTSPVVSIIPLGNNLTYDITVEDDHSYVANNIVTHNTTRTKHKSVANIPRVTSLFGAILRALFGVKEGRIQFGYDYASLEAVVQGHFILPYPGGKQLAEDLVAEKPNDCFDMQTELLTNKGWIHSSQLTEDTLVANWSTCPGKRIVYTKPSQIIRRTHEGEMIVINGERLDIRVTPNHILIIYNEDLNQYLEIEAKDLKDYVTTYPNTFIPNSGYSTIDESNTYSYDANLILNTSQKDTGITVQSYDKTTIVNIVTKQRLSGSGSFIVEKEGQQGIIYQTTVGKAPLNQKGFKVLAEQISVVSTTEEVWCLTVPTHYVFVKRNNSIYVASQCHTKNAIRLWDDPNRRPDAKSFTYALTYIGAYKTV